MIQSQKLRQSHRIMHIHQLHC